MQTQKNPKRVVVVGDVHGQFDPYVKILRHAKLIDGQNNCCRGHDRMLQNVDILYTRPFSRTVDDLLDTIQQQAKTAGGEVVRLVGNHELEPLLSNFVISGFSKEEAQFMREKMTRQVLCGDLRAAYAYKGYLFTHAGVTPQRREPLARDLLGRFGRFGVFLSGQPGVADCGPYAGGSYCGG